VRSRALALAFAEAALANYRRDERLAPIVALHYADVMLVCALGGCDDVPVTQAKVAGVLTEVVHADTVITVSEAWMRSFPADAEVGHGDLERMHNDGDTAVHTSLLVTAYDVADTDASYAVIIDADDQDAAWMESSGVSEGRMSGLMLAAFSAARDNPPPSGMTVAIALGMLGDVLATAVLEPDA
jgi:hypothetical protein